MRYYFFFAFVFLIGCKGNDNQTIAASQLSVEEQEVFKYDIIRYVDRLARKASHENKFDPQFDAEYKTMANRADLLFYYREPNDGFIFFAITKIAPSIKLKKVATVGKLKLNSAGKIVEYEEAFRTWKMEEPELNKTTEMLFRKYINNEDLTEFETANSKGQFYIEFPDPQNRYDKQQRRWVPRANQ